MSFDSHSLQRLQELGRKLPKELPSPKQASINIPSKDKIRHPIETEEDPKKLFHELMKASSDGNIPAHLISRLKDLEQLESENIDQKPSCHEKHLEGEYSKESSQVKKEIKLEEEERTYLYSAFKRLLLEE